MKMVCEPPRCSNIVELLEWFETPEHIALVMERPSPCMDLRKFTKSQGGRLTEDQVRDIMLQVVGALQHCTDRGVLHRDVKCENLLINTDTLEVKLIDFGCGNLLKNRPYTAFAGNFKTEIGSDRSGGHSVSMCFLCDITNSAFSLLHTQERLHSVLQSGSWRTVIWAFPLPSGVWEFCCSSWSVDAIPFNVRKTL